MINLPTAFTERMKYFLGNTYADFIDSYELTPVKGFRVNTDKISLKDFESINPFSDEKIPYVPNGFYTDYDRIGNHPYHHAGMIYVQEPAAMMPAECIDVKPDWKVLDMCAAPGGKSTQLKNKLNDNGLLVSNEIIPSRCRILTGNIERLGLKNVVTTCMDTARISALYPHTFDLVMVDAPCSGEGMFRKDDTAIREWSTDNVSMCAERQSGVLENAASAVKNGGYIIYSTCTFSIEENEMTVDSFLNSHPEFELVPVNDRVIGHTVSGIEFDGCRCKNIEYTRRFYPHISRGEGQFAAVMHNTLTPENEYRQGKRSGLVTDKSFFDFLDDVLSDYDPDSVMSYNNKPVIFKPDFSVSDGTAFTCGVTVGEVKKNYILPHHQFFMAMGGSFKRKIMLTSDCDDITRYLHGEEINVDCPDGWAVVCVDGCSVGGAKVVNGRAKNHYPKGLRIK